MRKQHFIRVIVLIMCITSIATKSYSQSAIVVKNAYIKKGDASYLYGFRDSKRIEIDTAYAVVAGKISIATKEALKPGMYFISTPSIIEKEPIQILLSQEQKEQINIECEESSDKIKVDKNVEGDVYRAYIEAARQYFMQQDNYRVQLRSVSTEKEKELLLKKVTDAQQQFYNFGVQTAKGYPETLLASIINCNNIPPNPDDKFKSYLEHTSSIQYKTATDFIRKNYWSGVDFKDTLLLNTPFLADKTENYTRQFNPDDSNTVGIVVELLEKSKVNPQLFQIISDAMFQIYNKPGSDYYNNDVTIAILNKSLEQTFIPDWKKLSIREQIKIIQKNKIGTIANNITLKDSSGKSHVLKESKATYILLYFYDPECHSCAKATPIVKDWAGKQKNLKIWSVYIEQDKAKWEKYNNENSSPENWLNLWDENREDKLTEKYWIDGIPAMYLLDKDKKVLLKNASFNQLANYFSNE
ncbi:DUF5106 domain-containing protein [Flavobacterium sp. GN10]|uniref:DUF5106 domain-containing protein n=1 Tax=Flavobacterium tagetis TaxID=2801336 RepID=A0ABS1KGD5_9FLAO|nr:thioredoxin-like domain-containing protein [Flavobacterium tagetis]MBL0738543.1 DUF5106 domain-containing protein [Flavobacterium tagetis]